MGDPWENILTADGLKAQVRLEKPVRTWGDSTEEWLPTYIYHQKQSKSDKYATPFSYPERLPFYDREALEGKMRELRAAKLHLLSVEEGLRERLTQAENVLMAMQSSKRELSTVASVLDGAALAKQEAARGERNAASLMMDERRNYGGGGDKDRGDKCIPVACRQKCAANFSARNRIMELTEFNHQLRRAQGKAESVARSHQEAADVTRAELEKVQGRLRAMPKRFTESRQSLEREVRILEDQRRSLQLAQRKKAMEDQDCLVTIKREQGDLERELDSVLDEIDEVEDDRDRWRRQVPVEVARAKFLLSQRADALSALRSRFGENAVEHAAFAMTLERGGDLPATSGSKNEEMRTEDQVKRSTLPLSVVADALRPAYEPDGVDLTTEALLCAVDKFGINIEEEDGETTRRGGISLPEFCLISAELRRRGGTSNVGDDRLS